MVLRNCAPGCFAPFDRGEVIVALGHRGPKLAGTHDGTLMLRDEPDDVWFEAMVSVAGPAADLLTRLRQRDRNGFLPVTGTSIGCYRDRTAQWSDPAGFTVRRIESGELTRIALLSGGATPAYPGSFVQVAE